MNTVLPFLLTYIHISCMVSHMKTTLNIDDSVMQLLRQESARRGQTMSELVESALRLFLRDKPVRMKLPPLPTFDSGGSKVDIANRDALFHEMEK